MNVFDDLRIQLICELWIWQFENSIKFASYVSGNLRIQLNLRAMYLLLKQQRRTRSGIVELPAYHVEIELFGKVQFISTCFKHLGKLAK